MTLRENPAERGPLYKQMNPSSIKSAGVKQVLGLALLVACFLCIESSAQTLRQKPEPNNKPWQEIVSAEGRFSVLMPETPEEQFVPVPGQAINSEVHAYLVKSDVATYAVVYGDLDDAAKDPELLKTIFDSGRDRLLATGAVRFVSDKDISTGTTLGREWVIDYGGAQVVKSRLFYRNGRLYQIVFAGPQVNGVSAELVKYYDSLAAKFFGSFKIKT